MQMCKFMMSKLKCINPSDYKSIRKHLHIRTFAYPHTYFAFSILNPTSLTSCSGLSLMFCSTRM